MQLADNVMHFARVLRGAGLPVGPHRVIDCLRALDIVGVERREDFYWTLASVLLDRHEQLALFDQAFHMFWREPGLLQRAVAALAPPAPRVEQPKHPELSNRLASAAATRAPQTEQPLSPEHTLTFSEREVLQGKDFATMTAEELVHSKRLLAQLRLPIAEQRTRRLHADARGPLVDLRASLREMSRGEADLISLRRRSQQWRHPPLAILCDISGSMSQYSRMLLHFVHAITNDRDRVHTFLFGTRLTNITRQLRHRDVDVALAAASQAVADWSGGTRIGANLKAFNLRWSRRVLGQNAVVLLISDGLDRDGGADLTEAMQRLHKSCRRLIWLNPLLRYRDFQALAQGVRIMLPHVDAFVPAHNLNSLIDLAAALSQQPVTPRCLSAAA